MRKPATELRKATFANVKPGYVVQRVTPPLRTQRVTWKGEREVKLEPFGQGRGAVLLTREEFDARGYVIAATHE